MPNLTVDAIVEQAFGRVGELGGEYPTTRGPMYRRVGFRQRQLFVRAAQLNPERFGNCITANLSSGNADLNDASASVPQLELVQRVEVLDPGTSTYAVAQEINIVRPDDQAATFAPRAYIRDGVVIGYGTDLSLVTSIKVFYARLPALIALTDAGTTVIELDAPYDTLLELDLVKWLLGKATKLDAAAKEAALAGFVGEEKELHADFEAHVVSYTPQVSRWLPPRVNARATLAKGK